MGSKRKENTRTTEWERNSKRPTARKCQQQERRKPAQHFGYSPAAPKIPDLSRPLKSPGSDPEIFSHGEVPRGRISEAGYAEQTHVSYPQNPHREIHKSHYTCDGVCQHIQIWGEQISTNRKRRWGKPFRGRNTDGPRNIRQKTTRAISPFGQRCRR